VPPFLRIVLQRQRSDLRVQRLHVDGGLRHSVAPEGTENISSPALELRFPRCDLIGVDVELLRKLSQCSIALDGNRGQKFIFRLFRQVIRAARIRYDQQVVFGLPHHLRMRSSPTLHVLKRG